MANKIFHHMQILVRNSWNNYWLQLGGNEKSKPIKVFDTKESQLTSTILKLPRIVVFELVWEVVSKGIKSLINKG